MSKNVKDLLVRFFSPKDEAIEAVEDNASKVVSVTNQNAIKRMVEQELNRKFKKDASDYEIFRHIIIRELCSAGVEITGYECRYASPVQQHFVTFYYQGYQGYVKYRHGTGKFEAYLAYNHKKVANYTESKVLLINMLVGLFQ